MGFRAATCGITRTAIFENNEVVIIVFNQPIRPMPLCDLMELTTRQLDNYYPMESIERNLARYSQESYSDYHPIHSIIMGKYDDAGWIQDNDLPNENEGYRLSCQMFHRWVVEFIIGKPLASIQEGITIADELYSRLYSLRISPCDTHVLGKQHDTAKEMKAQLLLHNEIGKFREARLLQQILEESTW